MNLTRVCHGTWSGGRFMHFGEMLSEERYQNLIRLAYQEGIRTFITSDVYGQGRADQILGQALADIPRSTYCLVGMIGHDFYHGQRKGSAGYPRFTDPELRPPAEYASFLQMACEQSLQHTGAEHFDLLMLHNPDERGYCEEAVWEALRSLKDQGLTHRLGIAPGPANGFTLDLVNAFHQFAEIIDWAMIILNPLEPWPGRLLLEAAHQNNIDLLTRVVDYGGLFWDHLPADYTFRDGDHRRYRPEGWLARGMEKMAQMRPIAEHHGLTMLQLAAIWNLSHPTVKSVVPTLIQERTSQAKTIEDQARELAALPNLTLSPEELEHIATIGDNTGCMKLKGASHRHQTSTRPDEWPMRQNLLKLARQYNLPENW